MATRRKLGGGNALVSLADNYPQAPANEGTFLGAFPWPKRVEEEANESGSTTCLFLKGGFLLSRRGYQ